MNQRSAVSFTLAAMAIAPLLAASARGVTFSVPNIEAAHDQPFTLTIDAKDVNGLGAFQFDLTWDGTVVTLDEAKLAGGVNGLINVKDKSTGSMRLHAVLGAALEQDGPLITLIGKTSGPGGRCEVKIEQFRAWSFEPVLEVEAIAEDGRVEVAPVGQMWLIWSILGGVVIVLLIVSALRKKGGA